MEIQRFLDRRALFGAIVSTVSWGAGYLLTLVIGEGLSSTSAYALIIGWWLAAYTASVFLVPVYAALPLAVIYLSIFVLSAIGEQTWFYRDIESLTPVSILLIGVVQAIAISSPILFNWVFRKIARIFSGKPGVDHE